MLATDLLAEVEIEDGANFRPRSISSYGESVVFRGNNGSSGFEPWIVDGADPSSTRLLKDIGGGAFSSGPRDFTEFDGKLFFAANNSFNGYELWVSQGTPGTTRLIADLWPGSESGVPTDLVIFQDQLFFFANDGESGRELYRSDGTAIGTERVGDLIPGRSGVAGEQLTVVGDRMFFVAESADASQNGLWTSDGTATGTFRLPVDGVDADDVELLTPLGDHLLFVSSGQLWISDGSVEGTNAVSPSGDRLGATFDDIVLGRGDTVWVTSERGLHLISADLSTATTVAADADGVNVSEGRAYYWNANGVYTVERDLSSTQLLVFIPFFMTRMGSTVNVPGGMIFNINRSLDRHEIWTTNGTLGGTQKIEDVRDTSDEPMAGFQQIGDALYFSATNGNLRESLWSVPAPTIEPEPGGSEIPGDFNFDTVVDATDIDTLFGFIAAGSREEEYDLNGDNEVSVADVDYLVEEILETRRGDADLNGKVEVRDFLALSRNFGKADAGWAGGDFDGDGTVSVRDFLALSMSFGFDRDDE